MSDFLIGCRAKIERAEENIRNLQSEADSFFALDPKPCRIVRQYDAKHAAYIWRAFEDRELPPRFAVLTGEILHHLRSSLDHLLCALVLAKRNKITSSHQFPIAVDADGFKRQCKSGTVGVSQAALNIIERVQPYNTGKAAAESLLSILHGLNIEDKHKLLVVIGTATMVGDVTLTLSGSDPAIPEGALDEMRTDLVVTGIRRIPKEGIELARLTLDRPRTNLDPQAQFAPLIAFDKFGPVELQPVIPALVQTLNYVVHVIRMFDGEFARLAGRGHN